MNDRPLDMSPLVDLTRRRVTGPSRSAHPVYVDLLPPCNNACPAGEDIQAWLALAQAGKYREAWETLVRDNPMPAVHGRVCYHPCESACNRGELDAPVGIHAVERFLGDLATAGRLAVQGRSAGASGKRILVIGAGPSGLSAAYHLARLGHSVEIHEAGPVAGGMMHFGIPAYRLPRADLMREIERIEAMGVKIVAQSQSRRRAGRNRRGRLRCRASSRSAPMSASTSTSRRATPCGCSMRFRCCTTSRTGEAPLLGRRVIVYGGGNTAMDAARTVAPSGRRRGADRLPARPRPYAGARLRGRRGTRGRHQDQMADHDQGDRRTQLTVEMMELDADGRPQPTGQFETLPADAVVLALGQTTDSGFLRNVPGRGIRRRRHGGRRDTNMMTGHPGLFAGGDAIAGERSVTIAVGHGKTRGPQYRCLAARRGLRGAAEGRRSCPSTCCICRSTATPIRARNGRWRPPDGSADSRKCVQWPRAKAARYEAQRCLSCGNCFECDNCYAACPETAIVSLGPTHGYRDRHGSVHRLRRVRRTMPCHAMEMVPDTAIRSRVPVRHVR